VSVIVEIPPPLRLLTDGLDEVELEGATVEAVLQALGARFPALLSRIFQDGKPSLCMSFYLNEDDVHYLDGPATAVKSGDRLLIQPPVCG
jgi:molybdopterin synthase sulfur carrier subunit